MRMDEDRVKVAGVMMSREEARIVEEERRRMFGRLIFSKQFAVYAYGVVVAGFAACASFYFGMYAGINLGYYAYAIGSFEIVIAVVIAFRYMRVVREQLRKTMNRLGRRVCLKCAFEISNDSPHRDICPECGTGFEWGDDRSRERE